MAKTFVDTESLAQLLEKKISPRTLEKWRVNGRGPAYFKLSGRVLYDLKDVEEWLAASRRTNTSKENGHAR